MKNIIFQYMILNDAVNERGDIKLGDQKFKRADLYQQMAMISKKSFEKYAEICGAEYLYSEDRVYTKGHEDAISTLFECLRVIYDPYFDQFDKVLFVDTDIVANTKENIFEESDAEVYGVLESDIRTEIEGGYNAWDYQDRVWLDYVEKFKMHDVPLIPSFGIGHSFDSKLTIFNTGVVVWTKEARLKARKKFSSWEEWLWPDRMNKKNKVHHMSICNDQPFISGQLMKHEFDVESIHQKWNDTPCHYANPQSWIEGKEERKVNFAHYTGGEHKIKMLNAYKNNQFPIFQDNWETEWDI